MFVQPQPAINHANIYFWKTLREMIKTIHVCKNVRGSGKWLFTLYWTSRSYLKILSSNLCSVSYELDQESEQLDLSMQLLSLNPLKWLTDSGNVFRLTMYFKDWLVTWLLVFRLAAFYILTLMQFIPLECFQIILSRVLGIGLSVSQINQMRRS